MSIKTSLDKDISLVISHLDMIHVDKDISLMISHLDMIRHDIARMGTVP